MQSHVSISSVKIAQVVCIAVSLSVCGHAAAQKSPIKTPSPLPQDVTPKVFEGECGGFGGQFGPFDYRTAHPDDKRVVEKFHFDKEYAAFVKGKLTTDAIGSGGLEVGKGFQYVLNSIPNHPAALLAMERLGSRLNSERPQQTQYPLECWYVRAFKIAPDDPVVRAMYGTYLANRGRSKEALHNLDIADLGLINDANMQYNIGLMNFKLGKFERAQLNSLRATMLGFRLDGLEKMLKRGGHWDPKLTLPVEEPVQGLQPPLEKAE